MWICTATQRDTLAFQTKTNNTMNGKLILATIVGTVVAFLLGWLIWGMLLADWSNAQMHNPDGSQIYHGLVRGDEDFMGRMWAVALANLLQAFMLAWIFQKWANINTAVQGFIWGTVLFFLMAGSSALLNWSMLNLMTAQAHVIDTLVTAVYGGLVGAVIALTLGTGKKAAA